MLLEETSIDVLGSQLREGLPDRDALRKVQP